MRFFKYAFGGFLILAMLSTIGSFLRGPSIKSGSAPLPQPAPAASRVKAEPQIRVYQQRETVRVGYTTYFVSGSWWSSKLSDNRFLDRKPDAAFLFVDLVVRNADQKARTIPPFKLIDESGAEHDSSSKILGVEGALGVLESLNPGVSKEGLVVFDVPQNRNYKLKVSGGYWSRDDALIELDPRSNK
jgi:hypothetical protein